MSARLMMHSLRYSGRMLISRRSSLSPRISAFSSSLQHLQSLKGNLDDPKRFIFRQTGPEWHHPSFLEDATLEEKEAWLESRLGQKTEEATETSMANIEAFLVVLRALSQSKASGAPQRAEEWMRRLEQQAERDPKLKPTLECFTSVIECWARSQQEVAVPRAERWLTKLKKLSITDPSLEPTTDTFNAFLNACSKGSGLIRRADALLSNAQKTEETLNFMMNQYEKYGQDHRCAPDTESFNYAIRSWTRYRKDAALVVEKTMALLKRMEEYQRADPESSRIKPNTQSYCMVLDAYANLAGRKAKACLNDKVMRISEDTNGLADVKQVEAILKYMHNIFDAGHEGIMPSTVAHNTLLSAWARMSGPFHRQAPFEAEKVLRKMLRLRDIGLLGAAPDNLSYSKVILAWAKSGHPTAGQRAQWLLQQLWTEYDKSQDESLRPQVTTYNNVFQALRKNPVQAENLLTELVERENEGGSLRPNSECFAFVIHAWLRADDTSDTGLSRYERCLRAWVWLQELVRRERADTYEVTSSPDLFVGVLKAATKCCDERPETLDLAIACFDLFRNSRHQIDVMSYAKLLQTGVEALKDPKHDNNREAFLTQVVQDCRDDGLVSSVFVKILANGPIYEEGWTIEESARLTGVLFETWPLPGSWHRNITEEFLIPSKEDAIRGTTQNNMPKRAHLV